MLFWFPSVVLALIAFPPNQIFCLPFVVFPSVNNPFNLVQLLGSHGEQRSGGQAGGAGLGRGALAAGRPTLCFSWVRAWPALPAPAPGAGSSAPTSLSHFTASAGRRPRRGCAQGQLRNAPSAHSRGDRLGLGLLTLRRGARLGPTRRRCRAARLAPWLPLSGVVQKASYWRPKNLPRLLSKPSEAARGRRSRAPAIRGFGPPARERPAGRGSREEQWSSGLRSPS